MMRPLKYVLLLGCLSGMFISKAQELPKLQSGDLLFQNLDCGPLCDAIEAVTEGFNHKDFSHIGLVYLKQDSVYVIEAIGENVHLTPLDAFMKRSNNPIYAGRVKPKYRNKMNMAVDFALQQCGTSYDDIFIYGNGKYYCSELIYDAFKKANGGNPFFELEPMTFKMPGTDIFFPAWIDYYQKLGVAIPEGKPGINPGGISRSNKLDIINK